MNQANVENTYNLLLYSRSIKKKYFNIKYSSWQVQPVCINVTCNPKLLQCVVVPIAHTLFHYAPNVHMWSKVSHPTSDSGWSSFHFIALPMGCFYNTVVTFYLHSINRNTGCFLFFFYHPQSDSHSLHCLRFLELVCVSLTQRLPSTICQVCFMHEWKTWLSHPLGNIYAGGKLSSNHNHHRIFC